MSGEIHQYSSVCKEIHIPNEILSIIIKKLASDVEINDRTLVALTSCRLASHILHSLATPLVFSSIKLMEARSANHYDRLTAFQRRATKLKEILTTGDIAASVQTFTLCSQGEYLQNSRNCDLISAILRLLPHIRTFALKSKRKTLEFPVFAGNFASAIEALCKSPNFTTLDLYNVTYFPITIITACPNLQCLRLSCVEFCFERRQPVDETRLQPFNLDSLEIDLGLGNSSVYGCDSFAKFFSRIKNLRLKDLFCDDAASKHVGWDILLAASRSLTRLDFPWDDGFHRTIFPDVLEVVPFDLGQFPALRHFSIQLRTAFEDNATMLPFLNRLLSLSSSASGIETLEIKITWDDVESGCEKALFSSDAEWSTLDWILSSEMFVSLQKVVLRLGLEIKKPCFCHRNPINRELERSFTLAHVDTLFPMFRALTNAQRRLELHVEII